MRSRSTPARETGPPRTQVIFLNVIFGVIVDTFADLRGLHKVASVWFLHCTLRCCVAVVAVSYVFAASHSMNEINSNQSIKCARAGKDGGHGVHVLHLPGGRARVDDALL